MKGETIMRIIKLISLFKPKSIYRILRGLDIMSKQKIKTEVIQSIISDMKSISTYLEIGVERGLNIT